MNNSNRCKLCGATAAPHYDLLDTVVRVCARCDLHFIDYLDDLEAAAKPGAALQDAERRYIEERLPAAAALLDWRIDLLQRYLELPGARILDVGAGVGQFLRRLKEAGAAGEGIEPSRVRRRFAAEKFGLQLHGAPVDAAGGREGLGAFDALTLWEVIEHVNDPLATVRAAWRLLKPGGLLFVETHSREVPSYRLSQFVHRLTGGRISLFLRNFYAPIPFGHKQIFTPGQLTALLEQNGFRTLFAGSAYPADLSPSLLRPKDKIVVVGQKPATGLADG
jgi:2-polyprenyl-6-hydroxyphenyl methylase/3-demethylubiquinone-9 3-methyltransferase